MDKNQVLQNSLSLARRYKSERRLARAFAHYLVSWQLAKTSDLNYLDPREVFTAFQELRDHLEENGRISDAFAAYEQALEVLPHNDDFIHEYCNLLAKNNKLLTVFQKMRN